MGDSLLLERASLCLSIYILWPLQHLSAADVPPKFLDPGFSKFDERSLVWDCHEVGTRKIEDANKAKTPE